MRKVIRILGFGILILGGFLASIIFYVLSDVPSLTENTQTYCITDNKKLIGKNLEISNLTPELIAINKIEKLNIRDTIPLMISREMKSNSERYHHFRSFILAQIWLRQFSENQLIVYYLNNAYFGHGCFGIDAASKAFFKKNFSELSIEETAKLIAALKSSKYSVID